MGCIEVDALARQSLSSNRKHWRLISPPDVLDAASELWPSDLGLNVGELTCLAGGPPCQPFSKAAQWSRRRRRGLSDSRSHALDGFLALVDRFLPRAVLIENVSGFVSGRHSALSYLERALREINRANGTSYVLHSRVMNAADYGVPQSRSRAILVAFREGEEFVWPKPTHKNAPVRAWDAIGSLRGQPAPPAAAGRWSRLLPSIPEGANYLWHTRSGGGLPLFGYRTRYWTFLLKLAKNAPSWTVAAQPGPSSGPFHWDNRPLSIVELLRIQTFPGNWIVEGSHRDQVRQVGNATPPLLAEVLGRAMLRALRIECPGGALRLAIRRRQRVPPARVPSEVPIEYLTRVGRHPDHPGAGRGPSALESSRSRRSAKRSS